MSPALLLLALALPASAVEVGRIDPKADIAIERETWSVVGWNDACGIGFTRRAFPKLGAAIQSEPVLTRVGIISLRPGQEEPDTRWSLELNGALSWNASAFATSVEQIKKAGYTRPGYSEIIRAGPFGDQPGLADLLTSTATLRLRRNPIWPPPGWRWSAAHYNPLTTCALLVFETPEGGINHRFLLVRIYEPRARLERARAHTTNARLLLDAGELEIAAAEAETAAKMAPELAIGRYHHAALLTLTGKLGDAVKEAKAAFELEPKLREQAKDDRDFKDLRVRDDFQALLDGR